MARFKCIKCSSSFDEDVNGIIYCPYCSELQPLPPSLTEEEKEAVYEHALSISDRAKSVENIKDVIYVFEQLDTYRDASHHAERCRAKLHELENDALYAKALQKMELETVRGYKEAIEIFEQLPEWKNSSFKLDEARVKLDDLIKRLEERRDKAFKITMIVSACLVALGIIAFLVLEFLVPAIKYSVALNKIENGEYDEAYVMLEELGDYKDAQTELKKSKYNRAVAYAQAGDKLSACKFFGQASGYDDADARLYEICKTLSISEQLSVLEVGNTVLFGVYEQNPNVDGVEKLEWIIAEKNGEEVLLISKYAIEALPFSTTDTDWESSLVREWLNGDFVERSFVRADRARIREKSITTIYTDAQGIEQIEITQDRAFLLSANEAGRYFKTNDERSALATEYLKTKEAHVNLDNGMAHYWLRTVAPSGDIMYVNGSGAVNESGKPSEKIMAIRPAIWINAN